jgi:SAM-dependent methyltransferase
MTYDGRGLSFGTVAEQYDRFRPPTPEEAVRYSGDLTGKRVLDVGAGTGKLTRFLARKGAIVSAVEPDEEMRKILVRRSPEVEVLLGSAESVPAGDASFDAVFSSSAWHWFAQPDATNELARVLRDDGALHVWWNGASRDVPWMRDLLAMRERPNDPGWRPRGWTAEIDPAAPFLDVEHFQLDWTWPRTIEEIVGNFSTYSGAFIREEEAQVELQERVRQQLIEKFGDSPIEMPMTLRGTNARRRTR